MSDRLSSLRARTRAIPPRALDAGIAAVVVLGTALEVAFVDASLGTRATALLPAGLIAAAVLARRPQPVTAVGLGIAGVTVASGLSDPVWDQLNVLYIGFLLVVYTMASRVDGRRLHSGLALCVVGVVAATVVEDAVHPEGSFAAELFGVFGFFVVAPVLAGRLLRSRLRLNEALTEKAALAAADRQGAAQEAVNAERVRIASELHDLVAHALGAMTIQASAARRLAAKDTAQAADAFAAIETTGREALGELRVLLDVLRDEDARGAAPTPQPTLEDLPALVERARARGLGVTVATEGPRPDGLPAGVELTAYRVVQDALRAAREEGGAGAAQVTVRYRDDRVEVEVSDDGARVADRRLLGLQERVRLFGGDVVRDDGVLRARLPLERVPT